MMKISNYKDLLAERNSLQLRLVNQKAELKREFNTLKNSLKPMALLKDMIGVEDHAVSPLAIAGINTGIDVIVKSNLFAKAGLVARMVVPMVLKSATNLFLRRRKLRT